MLVKDQLRVRMDQLEVCTSDLARKLGVSSQCVQHWLTGRNFPAKAKCNLIETVLSFKLDFSEGSPDKGKTVEKSIEIIDSKTILLISKLPPAFKVALYSLLEKFAAALSENAPSKI